MMGVLVAGCLKGIVSGCSECVLVIQVELFEATAQKKEASVVYMGGKCGTIS